MYPGTIFNWHDESQFTTPTQVADVYDRPLFMVVSAFDKGTEDLIEIDGTDFANMYGTMSFEKYGQPSIQAQNIINAGGRLLCKRVVAEDSTLANTVISASISQTQRTDSDGNNLYLNDKGELTTERTKTPAKAAKIKWSAQSIAGVKNYEDFKNKVSALNTTSAGSKVVGAPRRRAAKVSSILGASNSAITGSGAQNDPFVLYTAANLKEFADKVNAGDDYSGKFVTLANDIDLNGVEFTPIGVGYFSASIGTEHPFAGTFDGNGHTISNLKVSQTAEEKAFDASDTSKTAANNYKYNDKLAYASKGLFGYVTGTVKNLVVLNANVTGWNAEAAVVGTLGAKGTVDNVTVFDSTILGEFENAGGVVGRAANDVTVTNSTVDGCVVKIPVSGDATSANQNGAGGLIGRTQGGVTTINGNTVTNTSVSAYRKAAGVVGYILQPTSVALKGNEVAGSTITVNPNATNQAGKQYSGIVTAEIQGTDNTIRGFETYDADGKLAGFSWVNKDGSVNTTYSTTIPVDLPVSGENATKTDLVVNTDGTVSTKDGTVTIPLFIIADNGRGKSSKAIRITPDYSTSRSIGKMFYSFSVYEGTSNTEQKTISFDPDVSYNGTVYRFDENSTVQVTGRLLEDNYDVYLSKLSEVTGIKASVLRNYDLIYGYTNRGKTIPEITIDKDSIDLNSDYGILLNGGSNGAFGDAPFGTDAYTEQVYKVFHGDWSDEVWDVDEHKLAAVVDANYPLKVKTAIARFVAFRQDCMYFRDLGLGLNTFSEIDEAYEEVLQNDIDVTDVDVENNEKFMATYATTYDIQDPYTGKTINVTMMYDLAACLVDGIANHANAPVAGSVNGYVLDSAIKGTINFTPIITPSVNQKQAMEDIRVNYAIFQENDCIVQSEYTSQTESTQLIYANNILAIQEVERDIRTNMPRTRYTLTSSTNLQEYSDAVTKLLQKYTSNFEVLQFEYVANQIEIQQRIFHPSLRFAFRGWAQTEIFEIYAINSGNATGAAGAEVSEAQVQE
jgi:hypothetical protein